MLEAATASAMSRFCTRFSDAMARSRGDLCSIMLMDALPCFYGERLDCVGYPFVWCFGNIRYTRVGIYTFCSGQLGSFPRKYFWEVASGK